MAAVFRGSRRAVPILLVIAVAVPIAAVAALALHVVRQDREIDARRRQDALRGAAARLALAIEGRLGGIEERLATEYGVTLEHDGPVPGPIGHVLYRPELRTAVEPTAPELALAEALEYQQKDLAGAAAAYRRLTLSPDARIGAGALIRLGALARKTGDRTSALRAYDHLRGFGRLDLDGQPAELIARQGRCRVFEADGDRQRLRRESADLASVLYEARAPIDEPTFRYYAGLVKEWAGPPPPTADLQRTEAAIALWQLWRAGTLPARGRRVLRSEPSPVVAIWTTLPAGLFARFVLPEELEQALEPLWKGQHLVTSLVDQDGARLIGAEPDAPVTLAPAETRLPFAMRVAFGPDWRDDGQSALRHRLLAAGVTLTVVLMLAAAYGLARATSKEMALVRQQSDFVAAVSHEFRTPLTSMRHLTELLADSRVRDDARKAAYYELLARETQRLHRMVETLLNYSRMQAGAYAWRVAPVRIDALVREVVADFRADLRAAARDIGCDCGSTAHVVNVDRDAVARALSNLLDNALKYSDPDTSITVSVRCASSSVEVSVADQGAGIPCEEQKKLFDRFVRGNRAARSGAGGIGIGLALVKSVAEAHGGSVRVESEPGRGSRFTMALPLAGAGTPSVGLEMASHVAHPDR